jgi:hypothetical protein
VPSYTTNVTLESPPVGNVLIPAGATTVTFAVDAVTGAAIAAEVASANMSTFAQKSRTGTKAVGQDELVHNVLDHGAVGDGTTNDTTAIQAAIAAAQINPAGTAFSAGGRVLVPASLNPYIISQLTLPSGVQLDVQPGAVLQRAAADAQTGPMVLLNRPYTQLVGKGLINCLNASPTGVVAISRDGSTVNFCVVRDVTIRGRSSSGSGDVGVMIEGNTACYQNTVADIAVNGVDTMVWLTGGQANGNELRNIQGSNIFAIGYDFNGATENRVNGGMITSSSNNITVLKLRSPAQGNHIATNAEPGGTAIAYSVDAGCTNNTIGPGYLNCSGAPVDSGTRTTILRHDMSIFPQIRVNTVATGAGSAALGANCPATTATAPYTWLKLISSDGSTVYVPAWK